MASKIFEESLNSVSNYSEIFVKKSFSVIEYTCYLLEQKNMTTKDLAVKLNTSEVEINKILSPGYDMTFKIIAKIEDALGESIVIIPKPEENAVSPKQNEKHLQVQSK